MAYSIDTNAWTPLDWLSSQNDGSPWPTIEDYADEKEYYESDELLRELYDRHNAFKNWESPRCEELRNRYRELFPKMIAHFLQNVGQAILDGKIKLNVVFDEPRDHGQDNAGIF